MDKTAQKVSLEWQVELICSQCGKSAIPVFNGWRKEYTLKIGNTPVIYADLTCPECGRELKDEAGRKLIELFKDMPLAPKKSPSVARFLIILVGVAVVLYLGGYFGSLAGFWEGQSYLGPVFIWLLLFPVYHVYRARFAPIHLECTCGEPSFVIMGKLGGTFCYSCMNCGRMLRVRD